MLEHRLRIVRADEEVAYGGQDLHEKVPRLLRRPQAAPIVDVERQGRAGRGRLAHRTPDDLAEILAERGRDPGQMQETGAPQPRPVHVLRLRGGSSPNRADRTGCGPGAAPCRTPGSTGPCAPPGAEHPAQSTPWPVSSRRAVRPGMLGRQRGDERGAQPEARAGGGHVGLGAADLHVQVAACSSRCGRAARPAAASPLPARPGRAHARAGSARWRRAGR